MAGKNTIDAKLKIAADFAEAVQQLQRLRAEMKGAKADASAVGGDAGTKAATQAQKDTATAARTAATERTRAAREASEAEKAAAREAAAEERRRRQAEIDAARAASREKKRLAKETADAERAATQAARRESRQQAQLAPQVTDIVTGLAGGQNPLLVAIQQGGQLRDIMGGTGNAVRALLGLFTPLRIAIGGAAGVAALFGKAFFDARSEVDQLNRSITQTGNTAGTTAAEVNAQAQQIARAQNTSVSAVRDTFSALLESGRFTRTTLNQAASAATAFSKATGQGADEAVKSFIDMSGGVTAWALKTNQQYRFVTAAQIDRIRTLESEGKAQEAMRVALEAFGTTMEQRVVPSTNSLERAWQSFGRTISNVWESWKGFFRDATQEGQIADARKRIGELEKALASSANLGSFRPRMRAELEELRQYVSEQERLAIADKNARQARADAEQKAAEEVARQAKGFQDALASVDSAGAQKRLAQELAVLNQRKAAVELAHSQGLTSELDYNLKLNAIEQQRLQAQAANIQRQIEIESGRKVDTEADAKGRDARVLQLQAQLIDIRSQLSQSVSDAQELVASDALSDAREQAKTWESIWRQSINAVQQLRQRNAVDRAAVSAETSDPAARAEAAAAAAIATLREQVRQAEEGLTIQLGLKIPENMKEELRRQLKQLTVELNEAEATTGRKARLESYRDQLAQLQAELNQRLGEIDQAAANGAITSAEAERLAIAERAKTIPQLERILTLQQALAATAGEKKQASQSAAEIDRLKAQALEVEMVMRTSVRDSFAQTFTDFVTGAKSAGEALRDFVKGVAQAMLNLIARRLGEQLVNSLFGAQGSGSGGSTGGGWAQFIASFFHGGGVVGGVQSMTRAVSPMLFATAARYHGGGIAGLAPDEVPAVLRKGEEVLTEDDPRHRANSGGGRIENLKIEVNVSGANANNAEQQQLGDKLGRAIRATVYQVMGEESRPGGILAGRS
jgi:phage-related minor tail protein